MKYLSFYFFNSPDKTPQCRTGWQRNFALYISRVDGPGTEQRIFMDISGLSTGLDDAIAVNPIDGSVWFVVYGLVEGSGRGVYRIDAANASLISGNDYLADITLEITLTGTDEINLYWNGMDISPDGKFLAIANVSDTDRLLVYNIPEPATQDGRGLRRYKKRWKVERFFAWFQNFRRLVVRYEYHLSNFLAMVQLGCIVILLRRVLG